MFSNNNNMTDSTNHRSRSFAQATFTYDGSRVYEQVDGFMTAAKKYKSMKNLPDSDALRSLPFILKDDAAKWWDGIKDNITTWKQFEAQFRKTFAPKKPGYIIFQEIAEMKQKPDERTERFVAKQRALFNQLPSPGFTEVQQLDMMYGNLHPKVQEQIPRECIQSFDGLLEAARDIERELLKDKNEPEKIVPETTKRKRLRCSFCRLYGHVADVCRKRQKVMEENTAMNSAMGDKLTSESASTGTDEPQLVISSDVKENKGVDFLLNLPPLPMVEISIGTAKELAFIDSGATTSLASYKLYSYLKNIGFHFQEEKNTTITLADGIPKTRDVLTGRIPVKLRDRCILTSFIVLPEARETKTLLGIGFIQDAGIILNLPQLAWNFSDEPDVHYDLIMDDF